MNIDRSKWYTIDFKLYIIYVQYNILLHNFAHVLHNFVPKICKFFRLQKQDLRFYPISEAAQLSNRSKMTWRICGGNQGSGLTRNGCLRPLHLLDSQESFDISDPDDEKELVFGRLYCIFRIALYSDTAMQEEHEERNLVLLQVDFIIHIWLMFYINLTHKFDIRFIQVWHTSLTYVFIQIWHTNLTYVLHKFDIQIWHTFYTNLTYKFDLCSKKAIDLKKPHVWCMRM